MWSRKLNNNHTTLNNENKNNTIKNTNNNEEALESRSYGFKDDDIMYPHEYQTDMSNIWEPKASTKSVSQKIREPEIDDYGEPNKSDKLNRSEEMDSSERFNESDKLEVPEDDDFEQVKKVKEVSSIISLKPKERNKALDPIIDQQSHTPIRIVRPMRDLSIIVRNRQHPVIIARQVPFHWIPRSNYYPKHKPHLPSMPKHKPCKPCEPKVRKKHPHKPKKPKKKSKKGKKCHHPHTKKKPHHKKLIYYAPMPTAMNYIYGPRLQANKAITNANYNVDENLENEDVETETEKPFHQEIEDDVEEHGLAELGDTFDEEEPAESKLHSSVKT